MCQQGDSCALLELLGHRRWISIESSIHDALSVKHDEKYNAIFPEGTFSFFYIREKTITRKQNRN